MRTLQPDDIPPDAHPPSVAAWGFLVEQWSSGLFDVTREADGTYAAHFHDDGEVVPLADMAYNPALGLFRRSQFPGETG